LLKIVWTISKKAIEYHDPNNNWNSFKGEFAIEMITRQQYRISTVAINLPEQYFKLTSIRNNTAVTHIVSKIALVLV
jgi:hypothetical protein